MTSFDLGLLALLVPLVSLGLAWPVVARLRLSSEEKIGATVVLSLVGVYLAAGAVYLAALPPVVFRALPVMAVVGLLARWTDFRRTAAEARAVLLGQAIVMSWSVGSLALIVSYSGGGWAADWYEHWERTRFFLEHWARDTKLLGVYALPARPPLANLVTGALLSLTTPEFPGYQFVTTLLNSLVFLPAALLARRWARGAGGGRPVIAVLTVLLMVNPMYVENATFSWTKLTAAYFILSGVYFFLRARDADAPKAAGFLAAASLAAGMLAHYSAGPYLVVLAAAWLAGGDRWREPAYRRATVGLSLLGGILLLTWLGWSFAHYGTWFTLTANSSVSTIHPAELTGANKVAVNIYDTLVPHFLRPLDTLLIAQSSRWGAVRDWCFQLYQVNLLFAFGSVAGLAIAVRAVRDWRARPPGRWFWSWFVLGTVVIGIAVHGDRDHWGLAHICLQPLVMAGLAYLAANWNTFTPGWRRALGLGAAIDLTFGIVLQLAAEHTVLEPGATWLQRVQPFNGIAQMNAVTKLIKQIEFVSDVVACPPWLLAAALAAILALALAQARAVRP